jgi:moderate conductance mechanosensitive channel
MFRLASMKRAKLNRAIVTRKSIVKYLTIAFGVIVAIALWILPVRAQISFMPNLGQTTDWFVQNWNDAVLSECIRLDGHCVFKVASPKSDLRGRVDEIERRLNDISSTYYSNPAARVRIGTKENEPNNIYVKVGEREVRLLTVTIDDAEREGLDVKTKAQQIVDRLYAGLANGRQERQPKHMIRQGFVAIGAVIFMFLLNWGVSRWETRLKQSKEQVSPDKISNRQSILTLLLRRRQWNLKEAQHRFLQLVQTGIWVGGVLFVLGLFPYTRIFQYASVDFLEIPLRVVAVIAIAYLCIRLSYVLIAQFNSVLASHYLNNETNQRVQLRIRTISVVVRSIVTILLIGIAILVALSTIGINITPVLAGLGIFGVAVSLASQNIIKDAINGFLIILEDQYAVGDVINVGDVGGLVENINLRITQLRDSEGRLITIPNSEIRIVANLSSHWSRADLTIPVAYQTDLDKALALIDRVAQEMSHDETWQENILDSPQVLGVDAFDDRGALVRVWIKTQPLKQWDVSREFRRRIKIEFEQAGIEIPVPQQQVWFERGEEARQYSSKFKVQSSKNNS